MNNKGYEILVMEKSKSPANLWVYKIYRENWEEHKSISSVYLLSWGSLFLLLLVYFWQFFKWPRCLCCPCWQEDINLNLYAARKITILSKWAHLEVDPCRYCSHDCKRQVWKDLIHVSATSKVALVGEYLFILEPRIA